MTAVILILTSRTHQIWNALEVYVHGRYRPYQPQVLRQMMKTSTRKKKVARTVQEKWFADFPWWTLCLTKKKLFCFTC